MELLISIYPKYCRLIESQLKNYEFRPFSVMGDKIVFWVYETKPVKQLKYKMTVEHPITKLPKEHPYLLGEEKFFKSVSNGKKAYRISSLEILDEPITLQEMREKFGVIAPQNYIYINRYPILHNELKKRPTRKIF